MTVATARTPAPSWKSTSAIISTTPTVLEKKGTSVTPTTEKVK